MISSSWGTIMSGIVLTWYMAHIRVGLILAETVDLISIWLRRTMGMVMIASPIMNRTDDAV